ncbi:hypothetical protein [Candidatus Thiodictyon syntrophicum]|jgi:hypothetical protein|uniref:Uncharacterized protein n=1 Tax=Candidatus Thiodictyon syntrophicum TaxID=1166950 RepID=A0A2K8UF26_9GAMM|nr:hypothetical protein [Candidatus Thiodictyon syntrophicum]AUB83711.1 hypothetical protein THSYN_23980 [Candidatus Thiodictyon syntrophicum]
MTAEPIVESGMCFGPYPQGHCFHIEGSQLYRRIAHGVKMAEMIVSPCAAADPPRLWIIEAKSSTPRPETQPGFDDFICEIRDKLTNALTLLIAACLGRHENGRDALPETFKTTDLARADFRLVLVINGHQDAWCVPLQDALSKALHATVKTWRLKPTAVAVISDATARRYGLVDVGSPRGEDRPEPH